MKKIIPIGFVIVAIFTGLNAGDFEDATKEMNGGSPEKAINLYNKSCSSGNAVSCTLLGELCTMSNNNSLALSYFKSGCDLDYAESCYNAGYLYQMGQGTKQDKQTAEVLYKKACDGGSANACNNLGYLFESKNRSKAKQYYKRACDLGHTVACKTFIKF